MLRPFLRSRCILLADLTNIQQAQGRHKLQRGLAKIRSRTLDPCLGGSFP